LVPCKQLLDFTVIVFALEIILEKKKTNLPVSGRAHLPDLLRPGPGPPGPIWARQPRPPWPGPHRQLVGLGRHAKPGGRTPRLYSRVAGPPRAPRSALLRFAALSRAAEHGVATAAGRCTTAADSPPCRPPGQAEASMIFTWTRYTSSSPIDRRSTTIAWGRCLPPMAALPSPHHPGEHVYEIPSTSSCFSPPHSGPSQCRSLAPP
jgi:hypothetical protein